MESPSGIPFLVAFVAGFLSFISPCCLPLVPSYLSYLTGISVNALSDKSSKKVFRKLAITHSLFFILGFSIVFILLGATATVTGQILLAYKRTLSTFGGGLIIALGLYTSGLLNLNLLHREKRVKLENRPETYLGSGLVGISFAAGWTPCIGPILGSILIYAGTLENVKTGIWLLTVYSLGLAIPFFLAALALERFIKFFEGYKKLMRFSSIVSGIFLIGFGSLIATGYWPIFASYLIKSLPFLILN